jgi:hypothetical protein
MELQFHPGPARKVYIDTDIDIYTYLYIRIQFSIIHTYCVCILRIHKRTKRLCPNHKINPLITQRAL